MTENQVFILGAVVGFIFGLSIFMIPNSEIVDKKCPSSDTWFSENSICSGSANLYREYAGSWCPPDSLENYPCRFDRKKSSKNEEVFLGIEQKMQPITDYFIERNKGLLAEKKKRQEEEAKKQAWEDFYVGYLDDGKYSSQYLKDCAYWQTHYYKMEVRSDIQDECSTGVGCIGKNCVCGFKMIKKDPWGIIHEIACDFQGKYSFIP